MHNDFSALSRQHIERSFSRPQQIIHVIAGLSPDHGGPSYSVPRLCRELAEIGAQVNLLSVAGKSGPQVATAQHEGWREARFPWTCSHVPFLRDFRLSFGFWNELTRLAAAADVIHNHGLWLIPNVAAEWAANRSKKPLLVSPRGMLSSVALSFSRRKKEVWRRLFREAPIHGACCVHVTSEHEYNDVRAFGLKNAVALIPNGVDIPEMDETVRTPVNSRRVVLSLGRIHPKKGLDRLLLAWAKLEPDFPEWCLRIAGPEEAGFGDQLRRIVDRRLLSRVSIESSLRDSARLEAYRAADLFVLPTLNENFGMTVAEALAAGTPVISTRGAPWSGLETEDCGWWIEHGVEALAAQLRIAMKLPRDILKAMGARGRSWMAKDYSWRRVATDMLAVYGWVGGHNAKPPTVRLD